MTQSSTSPLKALSDRVEEVPGSWVRWTTGPDAALGAKEKGFRTHLDSWGESVCVSCFLVMP